MSRSMSPLMPLAELSPALDERIGRIVSESRAPGAAVAVVFGERRYYATWGVRRQGQKARVSPRTLFDLGSCSKSFVATAIAMLVGDGTLDFDDPVSRWLPEMQLETRALTARLTVRDLLCNRIGLKRQVPVETLVNPSLSALDLVQRVRHLDRLHPFREGYVYFNPGFMAARLIVERASGLPYGEFLRRRLFEPLGMRRTASGSDRVAAFSDRSTGHVAWRDAIRSVDEGPFDNWQGAAGVHSCANDMTRWLAFLLRGGGTLLPEPLLAETQVPHTLIPRAECKLIHCPPEASAAWYGMGWWMTLLNERRLVQHAGEMVGWRAHVAMLPDANVGVAVMLSLGVPRHAAIAYTLLEVLSTGATRDWSETADRMLGGFDDRTKRLVAAAFPARRVPTRALADYAGTYRHPACGDVVVKVVREGLELRFTDGALWHFRLRPLGGHVFESRPMNAAIADYLPVPLRLRFDVKRGKVVSVTDTQATYTRLDGVSAGRSATSRRGSRRRARR
jgi:CubicO group peptidase (beta-lactamase class C family)